MVMDVLIAQERTTVRTSHDSNPFPSPRDPLDGEEAAGLPPLSCRRCMPDCRRRATASARWTVEYFQHSLPPP